MTLGEFRKQTESLGDDVVIVIESGDPAPRENMFERDQRQVKFVLPEYSYGIDGSPVVHVKAERVRIVGQPKENK
jgi:hypothetical protein